MKRTWISLLILWIGISGVSLSQAFELSKNPIPLTVQNIEDFSNPSSPRVIKKYVLQGDGLQVKMAVSFPPEFAQSPRSLPVIFLLPGLGYGQDSIRLIKEAGPNIIVAFEYPFQISLQVEDLLKGVEKAPFQIAAALGWIVRQPWADPQHLSTVGISMGTFFLPLAQRLANVQGTPVYATVLAFGGADLTQFVARELKGRIGDNEIDTLVTVLKILIAPYAPEGHLPYLSGRFLVIKGSHDVVIPEKSMTALEKYTPSPKTVVAIDGPHIGENRPDILQQTNATIFRWLITVGAISSPLHLPLGDLPR